MNQLDCNLGGAAVLVSRAVHQATGLCRLIEEVQGRPMLMPAIEICAPIKTKELGELLARIETFDMAIFVSANAVSWGLKFLPGGQLPEKTVVAAVGMATARALAESGRAVSIIPDAGFDSESLLATHRLSAEAVAGQRILIFRGQRGRQLLGDTLKQRGALIEYAEVYQRSCPKPPGNFDQARWIQDLKIITATSNAILDNLFQLFEEAQRERLRRTPLVVISERMRLHAYDLGYRQVILAAGPDDRSIVKAICDWITRDR